MADKTRKNDKSTKWSEEPFLNHLSGYGNLGYNFGKNPGYVTLGNILVRIFGTGILVRILATGIMATISVRILIS